jgi:hypothetical protein
MDQPEDFVSESKSRDESLPVFDHPALEIVGYTGVQVSRPAGWYVNPLRSAHFTIREPNSRSLTPVRQTPATGFGMTANAYLASDLWNRTGTNAAAKFSNRTSLREAVA